MKKVLLIACCLISTSLAARIDTYAVLNAAQEKVRIVLKQMHASYNWLDTIYAARERYYLSGISLDYIRQLKKTCAIDQQCFAHIEKLEMILEKLHVLDLNQKEFEKIQCAAQSALQLPLGATKSPVIVLT